MAEELENEYLRIEEDIVAARRRLHPRGCTYEGRGRPWGQWGRDPADLRARVE